jgi:hypothetical protein
VTQLISLERRTSRSGKDSIDHPPGAHDDIANVAAGALCRAIQLSSSPDNWMNGREPKVNLGYASIKQRRPQNRRPVPVTDAQGGIQWVSRDHSR